MNQLPSDFIAQMSGLMPETEVQELCASLSEAPSVSIRINSQYGHSVELVSESLGVELSQKVQWSSSGYYLAERPSFTLDPLFHAGGYYVQEASSMFLEQAVRKCTDGPVNALDLCAAPGGKSTHLISLLPEGSVLTSNEIHRGRAQILAENMIKWGNPNVIVTNNSPAEIGKSGLEYDLIVVDAPCSGEGMFRKDQGAIDDWSLQNVRMCAERQRQILSDIWPALKPGGHIIYSTCTFNTSEDEDNVHWMVDTFGAMPIRIDVPQEWNITGSLDSTDIPVYHFMQHRTRGEGFFLALLQKPLGESSRRAKPMQVKTDKVSDGIRNWLNGPDKYIFRIDKGDILAFPANAAPVMVQTRSFLRTLVSGVHIASTKGKDYVPAHPLAMSSGLNKEAFTTVELTDMQALAYLHCEAIMLECPVRGIVLLSWKGIPLGFAKNLGNRANNMYPQEWRIRKDIQPIAHTGRK